MNKLTARTLVTSNNGLALQPRPHVRPSCNRLSIIIMISYRHVPLASPAYQLRPFVTVPLQSCTTIHKLVYCHLVSVNILFFYRLYHILLPIPTYMPIFQHTYTYYYLYTHTYSHDSLSICFQYEWRAHVNINKCFY